MSIIDVQYRTITCNGKNCDKTVTFDQQFAKRVAEEHPWIRSIRIVQTAEGRNFVYHSDECELSGVASGDHNPEVKKSIVLPTGANAQQVAAAEAQRAEQAT